MYLTENKLAEWVSSKKGLLITRTLNNIATFNFKECNHNEIACVTGYHETIKHFFEKIIDNFKSYVTLIIIETDDAYINPLWLNHPKLRHCFTWNKPFEHPKLSGIPIMLNYDRQYDGITKWLSNKIEQSSDEQNQLLCMNCSLRTSPEREDLNNYARDNWNSYCTFIPFTPPINSYIKHSYIEGKIKVDVTNPDCYNEWSKHKFVLSPRGAGEDCHRTWEAIITGCIPIVKSSLLDELYEDLPILVVNDWNEINKDFLERKHLEITEKKRQNGYNMNKLNLEYWTTKIQGKMGNLTHFITYGDNKYANSKKRIISEAHAFNEFDVIRAYGPEDLPTNFKERYSEYLKMPRGGGYWLWRPILLYEHLKTMNQDDILIYLDAGSHINVKGKDRYFEYINLLNNNVNNLGVLSFQMKDQIEKCWTTSNVFKYFNVDLNCDHANSGQYLGGIFILKKNDHSMEYVKKLVAISLINPDLFTDKFNSTQQHSEFKDNRHDQSVSSVLRKIIGSVVIPQDETYHKPYGSEESLKFPFWATRIRL
jgi:hypothetical protein